MQGWARDVRFGMRLLGRHPGFSLLVVLTLALGIGANTAIFSLVSGVLLKPLPYTDGDRLLLIRQSAPLAGIQNASVSIKEYFAYREEVPEFESLVDELHGKGKFTEVGTASAGSTAAVAMPAAKAPAAAPKPAPKAESPKPAAAAAPAPARAPAAPPPEKPASEAETTVRVDTARLDEEIAEGRVCEVGIPRG